MNNTEQIRFTDFLKIIFLDNLFFFLPYGAFLVLGALELIFLAKGQSLLWLNEHNNRFLDTFFYYVTNVGDGIMYVIVIIPLALLRIRLGLIGAASFAASGIGSQVLKHIFELPRPKTYFGNSVVLHYVPGLEIYAFNSFPSGHSTTAFSMFLLLTILTPMKPLGTLYFTCAILVALSRVYLVEHFFTDIYFGSILGVTCTLLCYYFINKYIKEGSRWAGYSVFRRKRME